MSDVPIISVEHLSKCYRIGHQVRHTTLRDRLTHGLRGLFMRRPPGARAAAEEDFWALRDVSFEVKRGEVVGIVGRNGAGKSTLLKVLSRITEPTQGRAMLRGRVASLLEVGTGFHPELTGRENVFLNGAILGMARSEIRRKFDEIVAFAEVAQFIDTPVKHYSSGMYVRLAFAVAAHLEPEILIVDEVLAVGDVAFQQKCLGKMKDVAGDGRTILFVSHNMTAIASLCGRALLLSSGRLETAGSTATVISRYLETIAESQRQARDQGRSIVKRAAIHSLEADEQAGGWKLTFDVEFSDQPRPEKIGIDFELRHNEVTFAFGGSAYFHPIEIGARTRRVRCVLGPLNLALGSFEIDLRVCEPMRTWIEEHDSILKFTIERQLGSERLFHLDANRGLGFFVVPQDWSVLDIS